MEGTPILERALRRCRWKKKKPWETEAALEHRFRNVEGD